MLLKYFELEGRFPRHAGDVPRAAIDYVAHQVKVPPAQFADYYWAGRAVKYHRAQIRKALGFREATVGDEGKLAAWLADEVCPVELSEERLREALVARCRVERIEPPAPSRLERVLGTARAAAEQRFTAEVSSRLSAKAVAGLEALVAETDTEGAGESGLLAEIKADPGKRNIETLVVETEKLARVRAIGLPAELFSESSEKLVDAWRARAARLYPSDLRASPTPVRLTLLASLCWARQTEITDGLVDLLITLVHKVDATAESKVEGELLDDLRRVRGKQGILFAMAEAALNRPDDTVRQALYPVVSETTLKDLVAEARASDSAFRQRVRTVLRSSYSAHYRRMLPKLLAALEFRCNNTAYRPVMDALDLLRRYTGADHSRRMDHPLDDSARDGEATGKCREGVESAQSDLTGVGFQATSVSNGARDQADCRIQMHTRHFRFPAWSTAGRR